MGPTFHHTPTTIYGSCTVGGGVMVKPQSSQPVIMSPPHISRVPTPVPVSPISSMGNQTSPLPATMTRATTYTSPLHTISTISVQQDDFKKIIDDLCTPKSIATGAVVSPQPSPYPVTYSSVISSEEPTFVQTIPDPIIDMDLTDFTTDPISSTSTTTQVNPDEFGQYLPRSNYQPLSTAPHILPGEYPASYYTGCMPRSLGGHYTQTS